MASPKTNQLEGTSRMDDWSNILDPASRKRAQNRIAQRNYRKNLKSRIEKLEQQAALASNHQFLPTDRMLDISDYDYVPTGPVLSGIVTRSNEYASYHAPPTEVSTFSFSGLGVEPKTPDSSHFVSNSPSLEDNVQEIGNNPGPSTVTSDPCHHTKPATPQQTPPQQLPNMLVCDQARGFTGRKLSRDSSPDKSQSIIGIHGNPSLAERIQAVLSAIHDAGFDGLESFVSQYYTSDLTSFPNLSNARRLSRNRGLPGILVEVRQNLPLWTEWEKQRYKEEVLRSAEAVLKTECIELSSSDGLMDLISTVGQSKEKNLELVLAELSIRLQNELPNLWALTASLTINSGTTSTTGTCDLSTTLSAMYMLSCCGIASGEDLRKLAVRCLQA